MVLHWLEKKNMNSISVNKLVDQGFAYRRPKSFGRRLVRVAGWQQTDFWINLFVIAANRA